MVKKLLFLVFLISFFLLKSTVFAQSPKTIVTVVNPIRSREIWQDIEQVKKYISFINKNKISSTWLLQYENLNDEELLSLLTRLDRTQEIGIFLEVSEKMATDAFVPYLLGNGDWARPDKVLLSGYKPEERLRLIDLIMKGYKDKFGVYPKSVGAWYIDTVSANYMVNKFGVNAIVMVSDQYMTDKYGLWGTPWGVSYFPSILNTLVPAKTPEMRLNAIVIQWAARDPVLGYGLGVSDSTYSVQANDYIDHHSLNTRYFDLLAKSYLESSPLVSQLTLGLEVGQESVRFLDELDNQINSIKKMYTKMVDFQTMSQFSEVMKNAFEKKSPFYLVQGHKYDDVSQESIWYNSNIYRAKFDFYNSNFVLNDLRIYNDAFMFEDVSLADSQEKLSRFIPSCVDNLLTKNGKILKKNIVKSEVTKNGDEYRIILTNSIGEKSYLLLSPDQLTLDDRKLISYKQPNKFDPLTRLLKIIYVGIQSNRYHEFNPGIQYTKLDDTYYFGIGSSNNVKGFRTRYPYFGEFPFPFQTVTRFKRLSLPDWGGIIFGSFYKGDDQCTINL